MKHQEFIDFKEWAANRVDVTGLRNRANYNTKLEVSAILARDYQKTSNFTTLYANKNIKTLLKAIQDLKDESFAFVCNICQ